MIPSVVAYASNIVALEGLTIAGGDSVAGGGIYQGIGTLTLTNVSVIGNNATSSGGGIYKPGGTLTVINSTIASNTGSSNAGVYNQFGTMTLTNSTVSDNFATTNGGGLTNGGVLTVTNSTISNNAAGTDWGGIYSAGTETLNNTIVAGNFVGALHSPRDIVGTIEVANNNLIGNAGSSGGIANGVNGNKVGNAGVGTININTVIEITLENNGGPTQTHRLLPLSPAIDAGSNALAAGLTTDQRGVGFSRITDGNVDSTPVVDIGAYELFVCPSLVTNTNDGGPGSLRQAIIDACPGGTIVFSNSTAGGAVDFYDASPDTITLTSGEIVIAKNLTINGPGANLLSVSGNNQSIVFVADSVANASISGITITGGNSGGFLNQGSAVLTNCAVSGNTIDGTFLVDAAGIRNSFGGTLSLINTTVSGNIAHTHGGAEQLGGGILNYGTLLLTNSTVSGNSGAVESGSQSRGGGIYNYGTLTLTNSTVSGNSSGSGGGIWTGGGATVNVRSSIIARNTGGTSPDFFGSALSQGFNLVGKTDGSGGWSVALGDLTGTIAAELNPQLAPLAYNGGPTQTHALPVGSPAIDKGFASALLYDQRGTGFPRIVDNSPANALDGTDIGAYEAGPTDATPPVITPTVTGTLGNNGWYTSDVQVSWSVTDAESSISNQTGCDPQNVTTDTNGITFTCEATSAGGTNSQSVTVKRDATAPTISAAATTAANGAGWYKTDVTVQFTCGDLLSGVASGACPANQTLSTEGSAVSSIAQTVTDAAGNTSAPSNVVTVKIDKTLPTLNPIVSPNPVQLNGSATATSGAADSLSGLASQMCDALDTSTAGAKSVTCHATDNAGNTYDKSVNYTVQSGFNFSGFFSPVDNLPIINNSNAGQAIPLKFSLGGYQGLNIFAPGYPASGQIACDANAPSDDIEETANPGGSSLTYDTVSGRYSYTWKTEKSWKGTCRMLVVRLSDGTDHFAKFKFK